MGPSTEFAPFHNLDAVNARKTVTPAPQLALAQETKRAEIDLTRW
jgi:hypothetical protein